MSQPIRKGNVLIIDDEVDVLHALRRQLKNDCYIYIAGTAKDGYDILNDHNIDVVISDQRMPDVPGNEFLATVQDSWPRAKLILLTGYSDMPAIIDAVNRAHIFSYIEKPWNIDAVRAIVHDAYLASLAPRARDDNSLVKTVTKDIILGFEDSFRNKSP